MQMIITAQILSIGTRVGRDTKRLWNRSSHLKMKISLTCLMAHINGHSPFARFCCPRDLALVSRILEDTS